MATVGGVVGKVTAADGSPTSESPAPTLNIAERRGSAAATIDPNMNSSNSAQEPRQIGQTTDDKAS